MATRSLLLCACCLSSALVAVEQPRVFHAQGEMAGEVGETSAILQSRLTSSPKLIQGDLPGAAGIARFELSEDESFEDSRTTPWLVAEAANDFIVKTKITGLKPDTRYYYRLIFGADRADARLGETCTFRTLQGKEGTREVSFVVVTGMNYVAFHHGPFRNGQRTLALSYQGADKQQGYPALAAMLKTKPDFFIATGDNVYYDSRDAMHADTLAGMRRKWHEQLVQPRFVQLFREVPTYWEKDDHDHRYNDCDRSGDRRPSSDLGIRVFREQVPVVDPGTPEQPTYRTFRVQRHLQIWLVEGRDYRSPNQMPDGPDKTLWGAEQIAWLKRTLLASDATFKLLISPTPMVGPDDAYKIDNHTNHRGFRQEGRSFFRWIKDQKLDQQGFYVICGDRHWQYHSVDPLGIEEFSCGALCDANSRLGRIPGDQKSTDPDAMIRQVYTQGEASGGFLRVTITEDGLARFEFFDEQGKRLHQAIKSREERLNVLHEQANHLLQERLLERIRAQYDARRAAVATALVSRESVLQRQQRLQASLRRVVGELPEQKSDLNAQVTGVISRDGYRIEKVVYESRSNYHVTANLYVPTVGQPPYPAVLIACGHSSLGKTYDPYQRAAILMASNGMVALVFDPMGQGERLSFLSGSNNAGLQHKLANVGSVLVGRTTVGYEAWDGMRSIDYLLSRREVDRSKMIGMTGNSGGGAQTMYLMALDDRIGPAAPACHITTLERNFELGSAGDGCQSAPMTGAEGFDHPDFFWLRAPRPAMILAAEQDYKDIRFTRKTFEESKQVYARLGHADRIDMFAFDDKHSFSKPRREAAVEWMRRWLLHDSSSVVEPDLATLPHETLQVTRTGQVLKEFAAAASVADLNLRQARDLASSRGTFWATRDRADALAEIRRLIGTRRRVAATQVEIKGIVSRGDYRIEKLVLRSGDELPIPALLFRPHLLQTDHAATLYVDGRGKATDAEVGGLIEQRVRQGQIVLSIDVRGFGETREPRNEVIYAKGDHRAAMWSMHLGQTLLGQRVEDVFAALDYLITHDHVRAEKIHLVGIQLAGPVALHAAALDARFASVTLRDSIGSWIDDVLARPSDLDSISHVVPAALSTYDLTDLASMLGEKLVVAR